MSRTDDHVPYWVMLKWGGVFVYEVHNHDKGPCDIEKFVPAPDWYKQHGQRCYPTVDYSKYHRLFGQPRYFKENRKHAHHSKRAKLKQALRRVQFDEEYEEGMSLPADNKEMGWWY